MADAPQPAPKRLGLPGLAAIAAGFLIFGLATLWLRNQPAGRTDLETDRARERTQRLAKLRESDAKALAEYGWVDRAAGIVGLPLERAIELALPQLKAKPVRQGPLIPPPAATNAPPAATAPAPAPPSNPKPQTSAFRIPNSHLPSSILHPPSS
ncbi:MAG: hypothetical protein IT577_18690 [Verrucomicrobiae bacterium]|nr:hypothetical protein [Verrucomicrobiae bacterium]